MKNSDVTNGFIKIMKNVDMACQLRNKNNNNNNNNNNNKEKRSFVQVKRPLLLSTLFQTNNVNIA